MHPKEQLIGPKWFVFRLASSFFKSSTFVGHLQGRRAAGRLRRLKGKVVEGIGKWSVGLVNGD
jgi:hypothetical protein